MSMHNKSKYGMLGIWATGLLLSSGLHAGKPEQAYVDNTTSLQVSVNELVLSVTGLAEYGIPKSGQVGDSGRPRSITITNTGTVAATDVSYSSSSLPEGTSISPASCGTIAPSETCVLTIVPGAEASSDAGHTKPKPVTLSITGSNTNTVSSAIHILTYGSVYRGGLVFAFDDTKGCSSPDVCAGSVGGKIVIPKNAGYARWYKDWGTTDGVGSAAQSLTDGVSNTEAIVAKFPDANNNYAANVCSKYRVSDASNTYDDWYLPALCEMGYTGHVINGSCGGENRDPKLQNIQSSLVDTGVVGAPEGYHWSSTEVSNSQAMHQEFYPSSSWQSWSDKGFNYPVRCVRAF